MGIKIPVEINPMNKKWCGIKCHWLETYCGCRFFCVLFGNRELHWDNKDCVLRHPDCINAEQEAMK